MAVTKYLLYIDYKSNSKITSEWLELDARSEMDAMAKADEVLNFKENVYLAKVLVKTSRAYRKDGALCNDYKTILCKRSGWIINDDAHGEYTWTATKYAIKGSWWVEVNG